MLSSTLLTVSTHTCQDDHLCIAYQLNSLSLPVVFSPVSITELIFYCFTQ